MYTDSYSLQKIIKEKKVLIAAHRGTHGGSIIQNSYLSYKNAILHGADIVEIDVSMTKDKKFFAFHNGEEKYIINVNKDIRNMTSNEVINCTVFNSIAAKTNHKIETLDYVLENLRDKCFINIDRSWFYFEDVINFLNSKNMNNQIIIKSHVDLKLLDILESSKSNLMYMPILKTLDDWKTVKTFNINIVAAELIFESLEHEFLSSDFMSELNDLNILPWVNSIKLNNYTVLSGGLDDNFAISDGYDKSWGKLIDYGFKIIQTDWPALLNNYINKRFHN